MTKKITTGEILPGTILTERDITLEYSISRTPVREILWHLLEDGLLVKYSNKGYIVRKINLNDIINLFQAREGIEGIATRIVCQKDDENILLDLRKIYKCLEKIDIEKNSQKGIFYGRKLHLTLVKATNNPFIIEFYKKLQNMSILTRNISKRSSNIETISQKSHLSIINAIMEKDEEESERRMREHLRTTCRLMIKSFYPSLLR